MARRSAAVGSRQRAARYSSDEDRLIGGLAVEQLADPVVAASSLRRTDSPLIIWNAWASVVDSVRSHSQVSSRSGLPNVFKNAFAVGDARQLGGPQSDRGGLGNGSGTSSTWLIASSSTSAGSRRTDARAKFAVSSAFVGLGARRADRSATS